LKSIKWISETWKTRLWQLRQFKYAFMDIESPIQKIKKEGKKERDLVSSEKLLEDKIDLEEEINEHIDRINDLQIIKEEEVTSEQIKEKASQEMEVEKRKIKNLKEQLITLNTVFDDTPDEHLLEMHDKLKKAFHTLEENKETRDNLLQRNNLLSKLEVIEGLLEQNKKKAAA